MVRSAGVKGAAGLREGMAGGAVHQPREESARRARSRESVPPKAELNMDIKRVFFSSLNSEVGYNII